MKPEDALFEYLREIIYEDEPAPIDIDSLPENLQDLGKGLVQLSVWINETKAFAASLADGQLDVAPPGRDNPIAGNIKALQATMNHIAWQAGQVTKGDYSQRIDFMGDLSEAFNEMTEQLRIKTDELKESRDSAIQSRDEYREFAFIDDMTGLRNRHYIMPLVERFLEKGFHFCIAFIDLDHLKQANDIYGHNEGDKYIREAARILNLMPVEKETARVGGDEFIVLIRDIHEDEASQMLEDARKQLMESHSGSSEYTRSFSYGIVEAAPGQHFDRSTILREADKRMYEYKLANRPESDHSPVLGIYS